MSRKRGRVETPEYAGFARRAIRAYGRRVADADDVDLAEMIRIRDEFDAVVTMAVRRQREVLGWSWAQIGAATGLTKQGAHAKWGRKPGQDAGDGSSEREPSSLAA